MRGLQNTVTGVQTGMNDHVTGMIIREMDYRDYDVILTVLTKEYGKVSFHAGGIRKMSSRNAGSVLPYTMAEFSFDYRPNKTMFRMKTARTRKLWRSLHEDLRKSSAAAVAAEACDALTMEGNRNTDTATVYDLLEKTFDLLDAGKNCDTVLSLFLSDLLRLNGLAPDVDECTICGKKQVAAISAEEGGFLCTEDAGKEGVPLSPVDELHRFRLLVKGGLAHYDIIEKAGGAQRKDLRILIEIIRLHAGINMKSFSLFDRFFDH